MSKTLIAAAVTALLFSACDDPKTPVTRATVKAPRPIVTAPVVQPPPVVQTTPLVSESFADAGFDSLAISHDSPRVDHLARAGQLKADGDFTGALVESRKALFTSPDDEDALITTARLARRTGKNLLAAEAWGRVARLRGDDVVPLIQQARALHRAKDYAGAVMSGRDAIALDSGNAGAYQVVGLAQLSMGELKGAIASFNRVIELEPSHGWAHNNLGFALLRANENEKAAQVLRQAVELLPNVASVHNNLGVALERTGDDEGATAAYARSMDLSPKYVKAIINASRVAKADVEEETLEEIESMSDIPHTAPDTLTE